MDRDDVSFMCALARADAVLCALIAPDALLPVRCPAVPRTHSAGTPEIAQDSGGDSISVNDASALQETLARIRQRYALFFNLPGGVEPGQERNIELALTPAALARYPGAPVRYRRVYVTPESVFHRPLKPPTRIPPSCARHPG